MDPVIRVQILDEFDCISQSTTTLGVALGLNNNEKHVYKYNLTFLFAEGDAYVKQVSSQRESSHTRRNHWKSELPAGTDFNQNSRPYIVLKLPRDQHTILVFHRSRLTPTQCLFFIGYGLHPRDVFFSLSEKF